MSNVQDTHWIKFRALWKMIDLRYDISQNGIDFGANTQWECYLKGQSDIVNWHNILATFIWINYVPTYFLYLVYDSSFWHSLYFNFSSFMFTSFSSTAEVNLSKSNSNERKINLKEWSCLINNKWNINRI